MLQKHYFKVYKFHVIAIFMDYHYAAILKSWFTVCNKVICVDVYLM